MMKRKKNMEYRDYFLDKFYKTNKAYCPSCDLKPIKQEELDIILNGPEHENKKIQFHKQKVKRNKQK